MPLFRSTIMQLPLATCLLALATAASWAGAATENPKPNTQLSKQEWQADLNYLNGELHRRHKNMFHSVTQAQWEQAVADLEHSIPRLNTDEILTGFLRLLAMVNDSHTKSDTIPALFQSYPVRLAWFGEELRVVSATTNAKQAIGARLIKIDDVTVADAYQRVSELIEHGDTEGWVRHVASAYMTKAGILHALRIAPQASLASFTFDNGAKEFTLELVPVTDAGSTAWLDVCENPPLYRTRRNENIWKTDLPGSNTVYVAFNRYPEAPALDAFSRDLLATLSAKHTPKLVVDLRANTGGDLIRFRKHLLPALKRYVHDVQGAHVYGLIGRGTFSAAMANAIDLRNAVKATLIGEPTGNRPVGYSENGRFTLPNSHITVDASTRFYRFQKEDTPGVLPDREIQITWQDYKNCRDPVLDYVVSIR